jgi:hypothetical protein
MPINSNKYVYHGVHIGPVIRETPAETTEGTTEQNTEGTTGQPPSGARVGMAEANHKVIDVDDSCDDG